MESITDSKCPKFSNTHVLVDKVKKELENKLYLLVLDDVWTEDFMEWNKLKSYLDVGAAGSKIIVTTRKQEVASVVQGVIPPYNLDVLSEVQCWSIIKNKAFSPGGAYETPNMKHIGEQIAKKCGGLPLAATFFGSLMHSQNDERHWLSIRDNKSLETQENQSGGIIPILKLSYDNLPSHLKQCFSFCCLFPKDWEFDRKTLIHMWMAEGFIHPPNRGNQISLEYIGNDYFLSLLSNSFFQDVTTDDQGDIEEFKMHDLVHDLALSVVGSHEATILNASEVQNDISQIRRLQLILEGEVPTPASNVLKSAKKLRTVFYQGACFSNLCPINNKRLRVIYRVGDHYPRETLSSPFIHFSPFIHLRYLYLASCNIEEAHAASISQLHYLQTLNLSYAKNVQMLLNVIGYLKNLRHLDLPASDVEVLPDSILKLTNLQTLDTSYTDITKLPINIEFLQNLQSLNISDTDITELPINIGSLQNLKSLDISKTKITKLPMDIGSLQNLLFLNISKTQIAELPDSVTRLYNLKRLDFKDCLQLRVLPSNFGALTQLRCLDLSGTGIRELPESLTSKHCKLELVNLGNSVENFNYDFKNLMELKFLHGYRGETRDMEMLSRLEVLDSYSVRNEDQDYTGSGIEELANLNFLRELEIRHLENVRGKIDAERAKLKEKQNIRELGLCWELAVSNEEEEYNMVLDGLQPHTNLRKLIILGFPGLKLSKWISSSSCLPNLVNLNLSNCNQCEKLPAIGTLPCLKVLYVTGMDSVKCLGKEICYQEEEDEESKHSANTTATTSSFPSLVQLSIRYMGNLETWVTPAPPHNSFPILEDLCIRGCDKLSSVPDLRLLTSLRKLTIHKSFKTKESIPYDLKKSLTFLKELDVDKFHHTETNRKVSSLKRLFERR